MYAKAETEASRSALLELSLALNRYHDDMVLAGGWAPYFISNRFRPHCGSIDIDFVLRTKIMEKYETIVKSILKLGYVQENEFRFFRDVPSPVDRKQYSIHLDFLCDREGLKYAHIRPVQEGLGAFAFDGSSIAFDFNYEEEISTVLPGNGKASSTVRVVDIVGSFSLKGQAISGRSKPKDFYDIYMLTFFNGSPEKAADYFNKRARSTRLAAEKEKLMKHSLSVVRQRFEDAEAMGPYQVEEFTDGEIKKDEVARQVGKFLAKIKL
ncbi:MAG: nucleotidyl transferase AbiEii/AbiGii toxin family protein [Candidatus Micrarchaeota archaeon]